MKRFILAAGVAALAIAVPAASKPGGGHGGGGPPHAQGGGNGGHGGGGNHAQQARGGGGNHAQKARGGGDHAQKARGGGHGGGRAMAFQQRGNGNGKARAQAQRHENRVRIAGEQRGRGHGKAQEVARERGKAQRHEQVRQQREFARAQQRMMGRNNNPVLVGRDDHRDRIRDFENGRRMAFGDNVVGFGVGGCPPGLADKGCMPPGQAKKLIGARISEAQRIASLERLPVRLQSLYPDTDDYYYRYGNGYLYQVDRQNQLIDALMPLFGLGYGIGQPFPTGYSSAYLPAAYQPFFPQTPYADYRYANGYVYQIDPYTGLIEDVDPLLGYGYGYGQPLPAAYSAYNVPYQYRPLYYDTSDAYYRYAPGAIYQVDPQTSLITGIASLLSPGLAVGQPLPAGYGVYNVPYDYRATYYDTPDAYYRYANGGIYRVDPTTQLVTALVASILT
jgi:hypothetical protein